MSQEGRRYNGTSSVNVLYACCAVLRGMGRVVVVGRSSSGHLGCDRTLSFELGLVPVKCLLPTVFQVVTVVMFRQTVLSNPVSPDYFQDENLNHSLHRRIEPCNVDIVRQCEERPSYRVSLIGIGSVSLQPCCSTGH